MKFIVFGDSICYGQFISPHLIWVNQLSEYLFNFSSDIWLNNPSISGNTTRMALERMAFDVQSHGIDVFYTQYGMNDCNYWRTDNGCQRVSPEAFKCNLKEIIARARKFGANTVFIGTNHPTPKNSKFEGLDITYQESNTFYNSLIREVAEEVDAVLVDHEKTWKDKLNLELDLSEYLLDDEIHLSVRGHNLYFDTVKNAIETNLRL